MTISKENNYNYDMANPTVHVQKTDSGTYDMPGLPTPPAGYAKQLGYFPAKSPDQC